MRGANSAKEREGLTIGARTFDVFIIMNTAKKAEAITSDLLPTVERGPYINGNFTAQDSRARISLEKGDYILKAQAAKKQG